MIFPDVFQALHRRVITKYWARMVRARVLPNDDNAYSIWRRDGGFVGPWHETGYVDPCISITNSRRLYEADAGLGNCSIETEVV